MSPLSAMPDTGPTEPAFGPSFGAPLPRSHDLTPAGSFGPFSTRPTVLLAEDDDDLRLVMTYFLETLRLRVLACSNAECASVMFRSEPSVAMLVTDLQMPGRSGIELVRELTASRPSLPILIVSGSILPNDLLAEIHHQGWVFRSKPCLLSELALTISTLLRLESQMAA